MKTILENNNFIKRDIMLTAAKLLVLVERDMTPATHMNILNFFKDFKTIKSLYMMNEQIYLIDTGGQRNIKRAVKFLSDNNNCTIWTYDKQFDSLFFKTFNVNFAPIELTLDERKTITDAFKTIPKSNRKSTKILAKKITSSKTKTSNQTKKSNQMIISDEENNMGSPIDNGFSSDVQMNEQNIENFQNSEQKDESNPSSDRINKVNLLKNLVQQNINYLNMYKNFESNQVQIEKMLEEKREETEIKIKKLDNEINNKISKYESLTNEYKLKEIEITEKVFKKYEIEAEIENLKFENEELLRKKNIKTNDINKLVDNEDKLNSIIINLNSETTRIENKNKELYEEQIEIQKAIIELNNKKEALEEQCKNFKNDDNATSNSIDKSKNELNLINQELKSTKAVLEITELDVKLKTDSLIKLTKENDNLMMNIKNLQNQKERLEKDVSDLKMEYKELSNEIKIIKQEIINDEIALKNKKILYRVKGKLSAVMELTKNFNIDKNFYEKFFDDNFTDITQIDLETNKLLKIFNDNSN